ncbi:DUF6443 domain-containing protein [Ulvibacterium sp.]|uniref:DUF6443 domain-containing protein n=1 Tax=Ulvibacterium sp. TaxID=2665914 RepID=UPI003CC66FBD
MKTKQNNRIWTFGPLAVLLLCLFMGTAASAQQITGPTSVDEGTTNNYYLSGASNISWNVSGAASWSGSGSSISVTAGSSNYTVSANFTGGPGYSALFVNVTPSGPPNPGNPTASTSNCEVTLTRTGSPTSGITWYWQGRTSSGTSITKGSGSTYVADEGSGRYYIRAKYNTGGWSAGSGYVDVTLPTTPSAPTFTGSNPREICAGQTTTLTVSSPISGTYRWYNSSGTQVGTGTSYAASPGSSTTYSARVTSSAGCESAAGTIQVDVIDLPAPLNNSPVRDCTSTSTVVLSAQSSKTVDGQTHNDMVHVWYSDQTRNNVVSHAVVGGTPSGTLATEKIITLQVGQSASYWVASKVGNCEGDLVEVTGEYIDYSIDGGQISAPSQATICYGTDPGNMANSTLPSGGDGAFSYEWQYSDDNSIWNDISGATSASYDPSGVLVGNRWYRRKALSCNRFGYSNTVQVTVQANVLQPTLQIESQTTCSSPSGSIRISNYNAAYSYSANPSTGVTIQGDLVTAFQGTYTITATNNGCSSIASESVTILEQPFAPGAPLSPTIDDTVCGEVTLTRGEPNPTSNATWYWQTEETGTSTGPANSAATVTLTSGSVYYLRAKHDTSDCWGPARVINYTIDQVPLEATGSDVSRCGSGVVTLIASPGTHGDEIRWYTVASGGLPLSDGVSANTLEYTTPGISSNTTYYAESYNATTGCFSSTRHALQAIIDSGINTYYYDGDNDGLGDPNISIIACTQPSGYATNASDLCPNVQSPTNDCPASNSSDQNYVYTRTYQEPRTAVPTQKFDEGDNGQFDVENDYVQGITYFDGLGRPMQQVGIRQSADSLDLVTHFGYDAYGRQDKEWLPFHEPDSTLGSYRYWDVELATKQYYKTHPVYADDFTGLLEGDVNAYSETYFETSPLNRVLRQAAPGEDWKLDKLSDDRSIEFDYETNDTLQIRMFRIETEFVNNTRIPELKFPEDAQGNPIEFYSPGELFKNITKDENHDTADGKLHTTEEYTDKQGRVVLKRTYADADIDLNGNGNNTDPNEILEAPHDTYYVYDDFGNLAYVLPPKMEASTATLAEINTGMVELGYQYVYDNRNRLVEKQLPGKGREHIVYDKLDRPIMTQDSVQRVNGEWLFTKYDAFGRVAYTGKAVEMDASVPRSRTAVQDLANGIGGAHWVEQATAATTIGGEDVHYNNAAYPVATVTEVLTINYYDNYDFLASETGISLPATVLGQAVENHNNLSPIATKGLATGSKVKVLDIIPTSWITSVTAYDTKARPVYTYTENEYLGTQDMMESALDFSGRAVKVKASHTRSSVTIVTIDNFTYDHTGRLLAQTQCIGDETLGDSCTGGGGVVADLPLSGTVTDSRVATASITVTNATLLPDARLYIDPNATGTGGAEELIVYNSYDALGQLAHKKVGGTSGSGYTATGGLQEVDYKYNVRGWLTDINDISDAIPNKLFNFSLSYNQGPAPLYNGNISRTQWRTDNQDSSLKSYDYAYDALNRIGSAVDNTGNYNLSGVTYDKNGNILSLNRQGHTNAGATSFGAMDRLTYVYTGNQLDLVEDDDSLGNNDYGFVDGTNTGDDFAYDANGNMTSDRNKGITGITYNHLNLPEQVSFGSDNIQYVYAANGIKLKKTVNDNGSSISTEYNGNYIYKTVGGNNELQFIGHSEGYITPDGSNGWQYVYNYKDHLGNVRLSYTDANGDGDITTNEIIEESNYYPFGLKHQGYNSNISSLGNSTAQLWRYNGQENEEALGLNVTEMTFRQYDPAIGRFNGMDRFTEFSYDITPYRFAFNNPIYWSDPSGLYEVDEDGNIIITNELEIENLLNYLDNNQGASVADISEHIFTSENFGMDLDGVTVTAGSPSSEFLALNRIGNQVQSGLNSVTNFNGNILHNGAGMFDEEGRVNDTFAGAMAGAQSLTSTYRVTRGNAISPKYYSSGWRGGSRGRITTYSASGTAKVLGRGSLGVSAAIGVYNINQAYKLDGGTIGYNTKVQTSTTLGSIAGGWAGAEAGAAAGAAIGVWFGGVGAVPGAIIGGIVGGVIGSYAGAEAGEAIGEQIAN